MGAFWLISNFVLYPWLLFTTAVAQTNFFLSCLEPHCKLVELNARVYPTEITVTSLGNGEKKLCVFCFPGLNKTWHSLWVNPKLTINVTDPETYLEVYHGQNLTDVVLKSKSTSYLSWPSIPWLKEVHAFQPFNFSCIGIASTKTYSVYYDVKNPEIWFVGYTAVGLLLFFFAPSWSQNTFLHYGTGISLGVIGSVLIAVFILQKFLPQKLKTVGSLIALLGGGLSGFLWIFRYLTINLNDILLNHWKIVVGYVLIAGLVSFAAVYRYGPITNTRSLNLVKWAIQGVGLILIYLGTQIGEMSIAIIVIALSLYFFPKGFFRWLQRFRYRYFPPKVRLLTEDEFYREGDIETEKALKELRAYCQSPECNPWRTLSRLSTPNRFSKFMEGDSHISDAEYIDHDSTAEINPLNVEDDSSESELSFRMGTR